MTFSPSSGGSYEAVVAIYAHLVVSSSIETDRPVANVVVKAIAGEPQVEIQTSSSSGSGTSFVTFLARVCPYNYSINCLTLYYSFRHGRGKVRVHKAWSGGDR